MGSLSLSLKKNNHTICYNRDVILINGSSIISGCSKEVGALI